MYVWHCWCRYFACVCVCGIVGVFDLFLGGWLLYMFPVGWVLVRKMATVASMDKTVMVTIFSSSRHQNRRSGYVENITMTVVVRVRSVLRCFNLQFGCDACTHTHTNIQIQEVLWFEKLKAALLEHASNHYVLGRVQ